ncbi:fumarylacetoacetate hydrolase family protein [Pseudonocardia sp.]|uniref:fumarylacetoacetate hydrolase family protein n=1 Tax=Pseudonocardia sp. TaxID=60912 RepID=UPI002612414E|nr:fumarylacetoacetate hydrolase family protein [Pseudonocardia sp.]
MRIANLAGRLVLVAADGSAVDVYGASGGKFEPEPQDVFEVWDEFAGWAAGMEPDAIEPAHRAPLDVTLLGSPAPEPRQVFAIGLNYVDHAGESGLSVPEQPPVFTKFVTSITGPTGDITLPAGDVDWEVELVVVIGARAHRVPAARAWEHMAGLAVGQDLSERRLQLTGPAPQFSLGKSHPGFGPIGPVLVTPDELADRDDLELGCLINGQQVQKGRTRDMVFPIAELVQRLSAVTPLLPGDVIFTGTPAGVGLGRTPQRFLADGDELVSYVDGIGEMRHRLVAPAEA